MEAWQRDLLEKTEANLIAARDLFDNYLEGDSEVSLAKVFADQTIEIIYAAKAIGKVLDDGE